MNKRIYIIFLLLLFPFFFLSCPMEPVVLPQKILDFELSEEPVKKNIPVELTVKWCPSYLAEDKVLSIMRLNNVEMKLLEGELFKSDDENALFVRLVQPCVNTSEKENDFVVPKKYCKLLMEFKEAGSFELRFMSTKETVLSSNFNDGYMYKIINVEEN